MKTRYIALLSLGLTLGFGFIIAQTPPAAPAGPGAANQAPKTELAKRMLVIDENAKALRGNAPARPEGMDPQAPLTQISDMSKTADSLARITAMKTAAIEAQKMRPVRTDTVAAADQAKFVTDYQAQIQKLIDVLGKVEVALKANKNAEAETLFAEAGPIQREGHTAYRPARGGRGGPGGAAGGGRGAGGPGAGAPGGAPAPGAAGAASGGPAAPAAAPAARGN